MQDLSPLEDATLAWKDSQALHHNTYKRLIGLLKSGHIKKDESLPELIELIRTAREAAHKTLETAILYLQLGGNLQTIMNGQVLSRNAGIAEVQAVVAGWIEAIDRCAKAVRDTLGLDEIDRVLFEPLPQMFVGNWLDAHEGGDHDGHTIAKHIKDWISTTSTLDWNTAQLEAYLKKEPTEKHISTLFRLNAEQAIGLTLEANKQRIARWLGSASTKSLPCYYSYGSVVGLYKKRGEIVVSCRRVVVVLIKSSTTELKFRIGSAYALP